MSSSYIERLNSETRDIINYLKNRTEICDLKIEEFNAANQTQINEWEIKNLCTMPNDLKAFYLNQNGMRIEWKFSTNPDHSIPLGKININSLRELTKVGTVLNRNLENPSLFDLEDVQELPKKPEIFNSKSSSTFSSSSVMSLGTEISTISLSKHNNEAEVSDIFKHCSDNNLNEDGINDDGSSSENEYGENEEQREIKELVPHFGENSCNFEIDNCNGFGKVCLVYKNRKTDNIETIREQNIKNQTTEFWFLDRSLQWHYLTDTFQNYYLMLIGHLGLPQWQALFTDDGLPPFLYQWYYMLAPGRILIHDDSWQKLNFLTLFETNSYNIKNKNQPPKPVPNVPNKIDFTKLFDDKLQKNKSQNSKSQQPNTTTPKAQPLNIKPKSRSSLKK